MNRERAVYADALNAQAEAYDKAPAYTRNVEAMRIHAMAVEGPLRGLCYAETAAKMLPHPTGLTACREQHYALNRVDHYTCEAMVCDMRKLPDHAAKARALAAAWAAYFNDQARSDKANDEDEARCAHAEHMDLCRLDEQHR